MKKITTLLLIVLCFIFSTDLLAFQMRPHMLFSAKMDGAQEVPALTNNGIGVASLMLNAGRDSLCINLTFTGLSGPATGIHIHSGEMGVNGSVIIDLMPYLAGNRLSTTITGTALTTAIKSMMLLGRTYVNVHTAANPSGEIRGQVMLETDRAFTGMMTGAQEVPAVTTTANGYAVFNVSQDESSVVFYVVTNGLSGSITNAHIHTGATGVSGGVIQNLGMYISGNVLTGVFTPSANVMSNLKAGTAYINVHTQANPGGEIRGQLLWENKISFDAWMDGAQEAPPVTTNARGLSSLKLNSTLDTIWYTIVTTGLSGAITNSHIHNGVVGVSGGVAVGFATPSGNVITGTIVGASLTSTLINNLLSGKTYVNVHTAANPSGEIRGQIYRTMREGYTMSLDGQQENPPVTTGASGSGLVSINRDRDNAHYMIATTGITPSAMHFHKAVIGTNGGVVNDIFSVYTNNTAIGYWKTTDTSPFSPFSAQRAEQIDSDSIYVNLHTTGNPSGEIRGQVMSGYLCKSLVVGLKNQLISENSLLIYPNPAQHAVDLRFSSAYEQAVLIEVYDEAGKLIRSHTIQIQAGQTATQMDMKSLSAGIYLVKVTGEHLAATRKLVIE